MGRTASVRMVAATIALIIAGTACSTPSSEDGGSPTEPKAVSPSADVATTSSDLIEVVSRAEWMLDPAFDRPAPEDTAIRVLVSELNCASGAHPGDALQPPRVEFREDRVTVTFRVVRQVRGDVTTTVSCPGNPWVPVTVDLGQVLGERLIVDNGDGNTEVRSIRIPLAPEEWPTAEFDEIASYRAALIGPLEFDLDRGCAWIDTPVGLRSVDWPVGTWLDIETRQLGQGTIVRGAGDSLALLGGPSNGSTPPDRCAVNDLPTWIVLEVRSETPAPADPRQAAVDDRFYTDLDVTHDGWTVTFDRWYFHTLDPAWVTAVGPDGTIIEGRMDWVTPEADDGYALVDPATGDTVLVLPRAVVSARADELRPGLLADG